MANLTQSRGERVASEASQFPATILHARSRFHHWSGIGQLSIKSFPSGQAFYTVEGGAFRVDETGYLLLNAGQEYSVTVECAQPAESFCLFFADGFADELYTVGTASASWLLENPQPPTMRQLHFFDRCYLHDEIITPVLTHLRLHYGHQAADPGWLEEIRHELMQRLLQIHHHVEKEVAAVAAMRAATREESYRRLYRVRDYIDAYYARTLTLNEMAQVACLSPNHLLRLFRSYFHQSPHHLLRAKRIEAAKRLLIQTEASVTEVCLAVGFESLGSFSWRFRRETGYSPEKYRSFHTRASERSR